MIYFDNKNPGHECKGGEVEGEGRGEAEGGERRQRISSNVIEMYIGHIDQLTNWRE